MSSKFKKISPKSNTIYRGDNYEIMKAMPDDFVDLIYIDPPFFTQRDYKNIWGDKESVLDWEKAKLNGFFDTKDFFEKHVQNGEKGLAAYLAWMRVRLLEIHRILKPTGSLYLHLDYHAAHYVKVMLDEIFGYANFRNEIVWRRKSGSNSATKTPKNFPTNNDFILFYSKSAKYTFNPQYTSYDEEFRKRWYNRKDEDGRWWKAENLGAPSASPTLMYDFKGYTMPSNGWRWTKSRMEAADKAGKLHFVEKNGKKGSIQQKVYFDELPGMPVENIWDDILPLSKGSAERTGWPTQKPVALLERIIKSATNEGDLIFDCFAGCGTSMHAAHKTKRKWVGVDISPTAMKVNKKRLEELNAKVTIIDEKELEVTSDFKNSKKAA